MQQPWGLSGPQFLVLYVIVFPVSVLFVIAARSVAGRLPRPGIGRSLTPYEVAYLAGGSSRVLVTGTTELMSSGRVHRSRDGRLITDRGYQFSEPIEKAVARNMRVAAKWPERAAKLNRDPALREIVAELRAAGLVPRRGGRWRWSIVLMLPFAVWVTGWVRAINGLRLHRPAADLILLLILSVAVLIGLLIWWLRRAFWPSAHGAVLLRRIRQRCTSGGGRRDGHRTSAGTPLTTIAVLGTAAISDIAVRQLINGPASVHSGFIGSGGGTAGWDSGCGSGGGGCGGGGGGGGGCGG